MQPVLLPVLVLCKTCTSSTTCLALLLVHILSDRNPSCFLTALITVCFSWLTPLLHLGHKQRLEENDMYSILSEDRSEILGEELQRYYVTVIQSQKSNAKPLGRCRLRHTPAVVQVVVTSFSKYKHRYVFDS